MEDLLEVLNLSLLAFLSLDLFGLEGKGWPFSPILTGSASEKETLRSNFPEDLECLITVTSEVGGLTGAGATKLVDF